MFIEYINGIAVLVRHRIAICIPFRLVIDDQFPLKRRIMTPVDGITDIINRSQCSVLCDSIIIILFRTVIPDFVVDDHALPVTQIRYTDLLCVMIICVIADLRDLFSSKGGIEDSELIQIAMIIFTAAPVSFSDLENTVATQKVPDLHRAVLAVCQLPIQI